LTHPVLPQANPIRDLLESPSPSEDEQQQDLRAALMTRLSRVNLAHAIQLGQSPDEVATGMLSALPDVVLADPPIGPCYSSSALARWKQLSRQAIDQQRRSGRLFGVLVGGRMLYPSAQFDNHGRQSRAFADLYADAGGSDRDPVEFAIWMETADPVTGVRPSHVLRSTPDTRTPHERLFDNFVPTIVDPPYGAAVTEPGTRE
jgi:hypothetical protein